MTENFKVPYTKILEVLPHPNADRLEIAKVYGFSVVVQKDKYKAGDAIVYVPIDSILPPEMEALIFPKDSKITLHKSRVRQIKIRSFYSQGMILNPEDLYPLDKSYPNVFGVVSYETDLSLTLNITKYEPPAPQVNTPGAKGQRNKKKDNSYFRKFNGVTNIKWCPYQFKDEEVVIQEKIHGSHIRFAKAPFEPNTLWKKILHFFRLTPKFEEVYGSNNVELTNKLRKKSFYGGDIYADVLAKYNAFDKLEDGEFVHGELYGPGIQTGYEYGLKEHALIIFDVRVLNPDNTQRWLNPEEAEVFCHSRGFDFVPVLYKGPFSEEVVKQHTSGPSVLCPKEKVREGCVVKSRHNYDILQNKQALKSMNPDYLDNKNNSDFH